MLPEKRLFNRRPLVTLALCYTTGVYLAGAFSFPVIFSLCSVLLLFTLFFYRMLQRILLYALCFAAGLLYCHGALFPAPSYIPSKEKVGITGKVSETPVYKGVSDYDGQTPVYRLTLCGVTSQEGGGIGSVWLDVYGDFKAQYGDTVIAQTKLRRPQGQRNPNCFDYSLYMKNKGIDFYGSAAAADCTLQKGHNDLYGALLDARSYLGGTIDKLMGDNGGVIKGMLLGDKSAMSEQELSMFRVAGLAHVLSVSGLHVGFIAGALFFLLQRLRNKRWLLLVIAVLLLYCAITAFPSSILRASIMSALMIAAKIWGMRNDTLTSISFAMLLILLISPLQAFDVGFLLSFAATFGIITLYPVFKKLLGKLPNFISASMSVSLGAHAAATPLSLFFFNEFYLYSTAANLLFIPVMGVVVLLSFAAMVLGAIFLPLGMPFATVAGWMISPLMQAVNIIQTLPLASLTVPSPPVWLVAALFALIVIVSPYLIVKAKTKAVLCLAATAVCALVFTIGALQPAYLKITAVDVGQGDCIYIKTKEGKSYLVDTGDGPAAREFLLKNSVVHLDGVILSHFHSDHAGGLDEILEKIRVDKIMFPAQQQEMAQELTINGDTQLLALKEGDVVALDSLTSLTEVAYAGEVSEASMAMRLAYKDFSMLFMGDIDGEAEAQVLEKLPKSSVLKVGHHGSENSASKRLLQAVSPQAAVISAGEDNSYGHPAQETLLRISYSGAKIYRTDTDGAVTLTVKDDRMEIQRFLQVQMGEGR